MVEIIFVGNQKYTLACFIRDVRGWKKMFAGSRVDTAGATGGEGDKSSLERAPGGSTSSLEEKNTKTYYPNAKW